MTRDEVADLARTAERLLTSIRAMAKGLNGTKSSNVLIMSQAPARPAHGEPCPLVQAAQDALRLQQTLPVFDAPDLFTNRVWVLMLELFLANRIGLKIPVTNACLTLGGSQSSAMRLLATMEQRRLIESTVDVADARRRLLRLTPQSDERIHRHLCEPMEGGGRCAGRSNGSDTPVRREVEVLKSDLKPANRVVYSKSVATKSGREDSLRMSEHNVI